MAVSKKTTAKKPAAPTKAPAKKAAAPAKAPAKVAAPKPVAAKAAAKAPQPRAAAQRKAKVSDDQRRNYVEVAAYYIAERNGFAPGCELEHWAEAEAEIDRLLAAGLLNP